MSDDKYIINVEKPRAESNRPNLGHIHIPESDPERFWWEEYDEKYPAKVWKRPWAKPPETRGRVWEILNIAVNTGKGFQQFAPFQVALMALDEAKSRGFDQIRIKTPSNAGKSGAQSQADVVYNVADLEAKFGGAHNISEPLKPPVVRDEIRMEEQDSALSPKFQRMPRRWSITDEGIMAPKY